MENIFDEAWMHLRDEHEIRTAPYEYVEVEGVKVSLWCDNKVLIHDDNFIDEEGKHFIAPTWEAKRIDHDNSGQTFEEGAFEFKGDEKDFQRWASAL